VFQLASLCVTATQRTFEQSVSPILPAVTCTVGPDRLTAGTQAVSWTDVLGFGVAIQDGAVGVGGVRVRQAGTVTHKYLLVAYQHRDSGKRKELLVPVASENDPLVAAVRQAAPDKWRGTDHYLKLRASLGFSNKVTYWVIAGCLVLALVFTAIFVVVAVSRHGSSTRPSQPASRTR
jgi:hypothetical protein